MTTENGHSGNEKGRKQPVFGYVIAIILFLSASAAVAVFLEPYFNTLTDPAYQQKLTAWADAVGWKAGALVVALEAVQIIMAVIPGGPAQALAGVLYGIWGGLALCMVGSFIGTAVAFWLARKLGSPVVWRLLGPDNMRRYNFILDTRRLDVIILLVFLMPGMPKDWLVYIGGITSIGMARFVMLSTLARIPGMLVSTIFGSSVQRGNFLLALGAGAFIVCLGLCGFIYRDRITAWLHSFSGVSSSSPSSENPHREDKA